MQKLTAIIALALIACGGRTSPATQPAPATYDASKNDPKALEAIDKMVTAMGGAEAWTAVKQIQWDVKVVVKGDVMGLYSHAWDRWNARHRFETTSITSYKKSLEANDPGQIEKTTVMYQLFERGRGAAFYEKNELGSGDRKKATENAFERWNSDSYLLTIGYRLSDPGVYVKLHGENNDEHCRDGCQVIAITFDPSVGKDKYWLNINKTTGLPEMVEMQLEGKSGRIAYKFSDWQEAGGLKFPGKADNIGARNIGDTEVWEFTNIKIGSPDDDLYIPQVR
jgi:hypothetical protein